MRLIKGLLFGLSAATLLSSCGAEGDDQGTEYAPNMYHSVAYEPYTQITDWNAGRWVTSIAYPIPPDERAKKYDEGHAEFFNSNRFNPHWMNMREPAPNTVSRNPQGWLPYSLPNDSVGLRLSNRLTSPLDSGAAVLAQGKVLYETYCDHCHGAKGAGDGKVATGVKDVVDGKQLERKAYAGVPNYKSPALINITEGHIFHVITYGKGLMKPHGSQVTTKERWKIARYVKSLQK